MHIDEIVTKNSDANNSLQEQIKNLINSLMNKIHPIGSYYIQLSKPDGTFDDTEAPSKLWEGTVWELLYNTESIFLRTEGSLSEEGRSNGIQDYATKRLQGNFYGVETTAGDFGVGGITYITYRQGSAVSSKSNNSSVVPRSYVGIDSNLTSKSSENESRVKNRLIRIYKRIA